MLKLERPKYMLFLSSITIYIVVRLGGFLLYGGSYAIGRTPFLFLNIVLFIFVYLAFITGYLFIKKYLTDKLLLVFAALALANIIAFFTMEDFHKIFRIAPFTYSLGEKSVLESLKSSYFEGFNYIAWMTSILYLLYQDLKKDILI